MKNLSRMYTFLISQTKADLSFKRLNGAKTTLIDPSVKILIKIIVSLELLRNVRKILLPKSL